MAARTRYVLRIPAPHTHLVEVEARFTDVGGLPPGLDLRMAAWTPGSYLVRDYARHVDGVEAVADDGRALAVEKIDKATWRVHHGSAREVVVRYRVFAHELTVRTSHVDASHAFLNGAPTFLWLEPRAHEPFEVVFVAPRGWHVVTALRRDGDAWHAADLDELLDSPFHAGPEAPHELEVGGRPHRFALWGRPDGGGVATLDKLYTDAARIIESYAALFGGLPYDHYCFMLMLAPGAYGGLEHRASTALLANPFAFATPKRYDELLELVSHEFFHLWNVKRIRPRALGPFDYGRENYTRSLWVAEGLTSYYDRYTVRRARLMPPKRYVERIADEWGKLLDIPGRRRQSIEESSFDAWIKLYRPDENSVNSTVSYYLKGGLVCLTLDLEIRRRTEGAKSLDDVARRLWTEYGQRGRGYDDGDVQGEMERATGLELGPFFDACVRGREDPDLGGALRAAGLTLRPKAEKGDDADRPPGWLGVNTRVDAGRLVVSAALAGGPAEAAGLYAGDEILAVNGFRVDERSLGERMAARRPGDAARVTVFRRDELREVEVVLGDKPPSWEIVRDPDAGDAENALLASWLGEDALSLRVERKKEKEVSDG
jgi:predicted metalloprotease with PDZ domain